MGWRHCGRRCCWSLVLLLLRGCWRSLGGLRLLQKKRAESLCIWLGDETTLCCRGWQDCSIPQIGQLCRTAGGAEYLELLTGLDNAMVSSNTWMTIWCRNVDTWCILAKGMSCRTNCRICVRQSLSSPPTLKQDIVWPSKDVSCKLKCEDVSLIIILQASLIKLGLQNLNETPSDSEQSLKRHLAAAVNRDSQFNDF